MDPQMDGGADSFPRSASRHLGRGLGLATFIFELGSVPPSGSRRCRSPLSPVSPRYGPGHVGPYMSPFRRPRARHHQPRPSTGDCFAGGATTISLASRPHLHRLRHAGASSWVQLSQAQFSSGQLSSAQLGSAQLISTQPGAPPLGSLCRQARAGWGL